MSVDPAKVGAILREAADTHVLPLYRKLARHHIREKARGEKVTAADEASERFLGARLGALLPGSLVVGEEGTAADPAILDRISGEAPVWIVDPIDGTHNFIKGEPRFALIVALAQGGETVAGWIFDPLGGRMAVAEKGGGAWLNDRRLSIGGGVPFARMTGFLCRARARTLAGRGIELDRVLRYGCGAHEYLDLITGAAHIACYGRLKPWDHAAGVLMHAEAGGYSGLIGDGERRPYGPGLDPDGPAPLLLAPDQDAWSRLAAGLTSEEKGATP